MNKKLSRTQERSLFEAAGAVYVFEGTLHDLEFGELPENHELGYKYFYSTSERENEWSSKKTFTFTNDFNEYQQKLSETFQDFQTLEDREDFLTLDGYLLDDYLRFF